MKTKQIEDYINENLIDEPKAVALEFVAFLRNSNIEFYKDNGSYWKDKIYYWLKFKGECVAFIVIKDPDEPENLWTVWSDDSTAFSNDIADDNIKNNAWNYIDYCGNCGSCSGGRNKIIFGREFDGVCGCTFRVDNPQQSDLPFLKKMVELCKLYISSKNVIKHYDTLIDRNNDPVHDPEPLKAYMDKWDGKPFIDKLCLGDNKKVLEIGVGTGRLAVRVAPYCYKFYGIDVSPKTIKKATENLAAYNNCVLICGDFLEYNFEGTFDVIYSSLTFMHIKNKLNAIQKVFSLLSKQGRFVLSIDKNQDEYIDIGVCKTKVFPDNAENIANCLKTAGFSLIEQYETEFAYIFVADIK